MSATPAWLAAIEGLINRWIGESSQAAALAQRLDGAAVRIDVVGLAGVRAGMAHGRLTLDLAPNDPTTADAVISGTPLALLRLLHGGRAHGGAAPGGAMMGAQIRGDAQTADAFRQLFGLARPDLEEEMARWVGDFPARRLNRFVMGAAAWMAKARRTAAENLAEYLQEESRDLVNRPELDEFLEGVDALRESADRAAARLALLEQRLQGAV